MSTDDSNPQATQAETTNSKSDEILTLAELAALLKIGRSTLYRGVERGEIPCLRIGAAIRFRPADVLAHFSKA
ncbi:MAG TPA: hypothetical protein DCG47_13610 [Spirochaetaceae bacterium]|jgi:excisionase family DNA binding protein|nr:hypothetical protein [Spirochaetaceae bacterium]